MKKFLLMTALVVFGYTANAQDDNTSSDLSNGGFGAEVSVGIPVGDIGDVSSFNLSINANYMWNVSEDFDAGLALGYSHFFGKEENGFEFDDIQFLPISARGMFNISDEFALGADLGYAVGIDDGNDGGFLWSPRVAYSVSDNSNVNLSYNNVSVDGGTISSINVGFGYRF